MGEDEYCDVRDKDLLNSFRAKRKEWELMFDLDEHHSIRGQLQQMLLDFNAFWLFYHSYRIAVSHQLEAAPMNSFLVLAFERQFVTLQSLHVRRLTDSPHRNPERQIISLVRLGEDIKANWHLFTRENYVSHDGCPFDTEIALNAYRAQHPLNGKVRAVPMSGPLAWGTSDRRHKDFDRLCGGVIRQRNRDDHLPIGVIERALEKIQPQNFEKIREFANKFVAHAADAISRATIGQSPYGFSIEEISKIHAALCGVANFLSVHFISGSDNSSFLPMPQFDPIEHLTDPWIDPKRADELRKHWRQFFKDVEVYAQFDLVDYAEK